jgi:hypothetical protein
MGQAVLSDLVTQYKDGGDYVNALLVFVNGCSSPLERKGIGLTFPTLPTEIGLSGPSAVTQTNSETSARVPGRVLFSL